MKNLIKLVFLIALAGLIFSQSALALEVTYYSTIEKQATNWMDSQTIPLFDPALGTLEEVLLTFDTCMWQDLEIENIDAEPAYITSSSYALTTTSLPNGDALELYPTEVNLFFLPEFDGKLDFAGTSASGTSIFTCAYGDVSYNDPADIIDYIGMGTIDLQTNAIGGYNLYESGSVGLLIRNDVEAKLSITYYYSPPNNCPVAEDDYYATIKNTPLTVPAPGVLENDVDEDGDPLTLTYTQPANGKIVLNQDGSFTYTPNDHYCDGDDAFTYTITDDGGCPASATVAITVECSQGKRKGEPQAGDDKGLVCPCCGSDVKKIGDMWVCDTCGNSWSTEEEKSCNVLAAADCIASGGSIETTSCCAGQSDFPDTCSIGACGCSPSASKITRVCNCEEGMCFDGTTCTVS